MRARGLLPWLGIAVLAGLYWAVAALGPDSRGFWQDDGIYLTTARSLAQGTGYRHIENPGEPWQTKYPILFPALLAAASSVSPDPRVAFLPGALAAAVFVMAAAAYARRVLSIPLPLVAAAAVLAAASPSLVSLVRFVLSDLPYSGLAVLALLCIDHRSKIAPTPGSRCAWLAVGSLLVVGAILTRGYGLTLATAVLVTLLARRRLRDALLSAAVIVAGAAPWWIWQGWASKRNGALAEKLLLRQDLAHGHWLPGGAAQTLRIVWQNLVRTAFGIARFELALPRGLLLGDPTNSRGVFWPGHAIAYLLLALIVVGFLASARERVRTVHVYALAYGALMLAWPFEPYRFLAAWTPFLVIFLLLGIARTTALVAKGREPGASAPWAAAAVVLAALFVAEDARVLASTSGGFHVAGRDTAVLAEDAATAAFVRSGTKPSDVIASALPARLYLQTGRRGVCLWHDNDPHTLYSGPERTWARFYDNGDTTEFLYRQLTSDLVRAYSETGVRYLLLSRESTPEALAVFVAQNPGLFRVVFTSPAGTQRVFAFEPASRG